MPDRSRQQPGCWQGSHDCCAAPFKHLVARCCVRQTALHARSQHRQRQCQCRIDVAKDRVIHHLATAGVQNRRQAVESRGDADTSEVGKPKTRAGEDISERQGIVPTEFFVHRHIHRKWACRCCQCPVQEPAPPQIIDGGIPAAGLLMHTPCTTLASWSGQAGTALQPLCEAQTLRTVCTGTAMPTRHR